MASSHTSVDGPTMGRPPCGSECLVAGEGFEPSASGVMGPGELPLLHPAMWLFGRLRFHLGLPLVVESVWVVAIYSGHTPDPWNDYAAAVRMDSVFALRRGLGVVDEASTGEHQAEVARLGA